MYSIHNEVDNESLQSKNGVNSNKLENEEAGKLEGGILYDVRLSLLTMTNPNELCDVLLLVCSKMADETNLSSKLPVADRTREV